MCGLLLNEAHLANTNGKENYSDKRTKLPSLRAGQRDTAAAIKC